MNNINIEYYQDASLKDYCTFRIGGKAQHLFIVHDIKSLLIVCYMCTIHNIRYKIIGLGANLLFDNDGYEGAIIVNKSDKIRVITDCIYIHSGTSMSQVISVCKDKNLTGLEALSGIPSTIGGAIINNLGAFNSSISDYVEYVECYHKKNLSKKKIIKKDDCHFQYRDSIFKCGDYIITRVKLRLKKGIGVEIGKKIRQTLIKKSSTQPLDYPSAGSIFKRGEIIPAKAIDELGLKGIFVGGAMISKKHAGFIINTGDATCEDVLDVIDIIKNKVKDTLDVDLIEEIEYVRPW